MSKSPSRRDVWEVFLFALFTRVLTCLCLILLPRFVPAFDASAESLLGKGSWLEGFVRWDVLHFLRIADQNGYRLEKDFAFQSGAPLLLGGFLNRVELNTALRVLGGVMCANAASIAAALVLHRLTFAYTGSATYSKLSALLYSIPPAGYVLSVPLTESFFALFAFSGMLLAHENRMLLASIFFAATTLFRANGLLNAGFIGWHLLVEPWQRLTMAQRTRHLAYAMLLTLIVASPFLAMQRYAYMRFCNDAISRPWCFNRIPLVYSFVQSHYWDVGLFNYWTLQQFPLFVLSAPVLAMSFAASIAYYRARGAQAIYASLPFLGRYKAEPASGPFFEPKTLPVMHLHTLMALILLFASHVQICLRQASTSPVLFWYAAHLLMCKSTWGKRWVLYCVIYGSISIVLWASFMPPA